MAETKEGRVKRAIKDVLKRHKVYWHCPVQNGLGAPSLDFICCHAGQYFAIEAKAPGKKPTERQERTIKEIHQAGGAVFVIDGDTSKLEEWLGAVQA